MSIQIRLFGSCGHAVFSHGVHGHRRYSAWIVPRRARRSRPRRACGWRARQIAPRARAPRRGAADLRRRDPARGAPEGRRLHRRQGAARRWSTLLRRRAGAARCSRSAAAAAAVGRLGARCSSRAAICARHRADRRAWSLLHRAARPAASRSTARSCVEARFGFNRMTPRAVPRRPASRDGCSAPCSACRCCCAVLWLMRAHGQLWWLYVWLAWTASTCSSCIDLSRPSSRRCSTGSRRSRTRRSPRASRRCSRAAASARRACS